MKWKVEGDEMSERAENVCSHSTTYWLLLSETKDQQAAVATFDNLGHGVEVLGGGEEVKSYVSHPLDSLQ